MSISPLRSSAGARLAVIDNAAGCSRWSPSAPLQHRRRQQHHQTIMNASRSFSTTPPTLMFDRIKAALGMMRDRGAQAIGAKTSQDKELEKVRLALEPDPEKYLKRLQRKRWGAPQPVGVDPVTGDVQSRILEHKYSTANFRISPRKLQMLADQIGGGKPVDYSILQMQFSHKRASRRIKSTLALARDHAIAKGLDPARLVVSEAWVGKGPTHKWIEYKGRSRTGVQTRFSSKLSVVLREGKVFEQRFAEKLEKEKRIVRSIGTGGVARINRPIINAHQRPGWHW